jgi:hypothetical protein
VAKQEKTMSEEMASAAPAARAPRTVREALRLGPEATASPEALLDHAEQHEQLALTIWHIALRECEYLDETLSWFFPYVSDEQIEAALRACDITASIVNETRSSSRNYPVWVRALCADGFNDLRREVGAWLASPEGTQHYVYGGSAATEDATEEDESAQRSGPPSSR